MKRDKENIISRGTGILIFAGLVLASVITIFIVTHHSKSQVINPIPTTSAMPSSSPTPTPASTDSSGTTYYGSGQGQADIAMAIISNLAARNWQTNSKTVMLGLNDSIDSVLVPRITNFVKSWDWTTCLKTQCITSPSFDNITKIKIDSSNWNIDLKITLYKNHIKPLDTQIWHVHMGLQSDGVWRATSISGPGLP